MLRPLLPPTLIAFLTLLVPGLHAQTSWRPLDGPYGGTVRQIVIAPNGSMFAVTASGISRSTDRGTTWDRASRGLGRFVVSSLIATPRGTLVATHRLQSETRIARSTDNGTSWSDCREGLPEDPAFPVTNIALDTATGDIFLAAFNTIHRSTDDGATWLPTAATISGGYFQIHDGDIYLLGAAGLFRLDSERYYLEIPIPVPAGMTPYTLHVRTNGDLYAMFFNGTAFGYYRSRDSGATWTLLDPPPGDPNNTLRVRDRRGGTYAIGDSIYAYSSPIILDGDGTLHVFGNFLGLGRVFRTSDHGRTWDSITPGDVYGSYGIILGFSSGHGMWLVMGGNRELYLSIDRGSSWAHRPIVAGAPSECTGSLAIDSIGVIYAATESGLYRSEDAGASWTRTALDDKPREIRIGLDSAVYAFTEYGLKRSRNGYSQWRDVPGPRGANLGNALAFDRPGSIYVIADGVVQHSTDAGQTWRMEMDGLEGQAVQTLASSGNGVVYLGTGDGGVFRNSAVSSAAPLPAGRPALDVPTVVVMPHPLASNGIVQYELGAPSHVVVTLHTPLGAGAVTLYEGEQEPGRHSLSLDTRTLPSGFYMIRLRAQGRKVVAPIVVRH